MATAFTYPIYKGDDITVKDYILRCARNFSSTYSLRGKPLSTPLPDKFEPFNKDYYLEEIQKYEEKIEKIKNKSKYDKEITEEYNTEYNKAFNEYLEYCKEKLIIRNRYNSMINKVKKWYAPEEFKNVKAFALKQLIEDRDFETKIYDFEFQSIDDWIDNNYNADYIYEQLEHCKEEYNNEIDLCELNTNWVKRLKQSLETLK